MDTLALFVGLIELVWTLATIIVFFDAATSLMLESWGAPLVIIKKRDSLLTDLTYVDGVFIPSSPNVAL